MGRTVAGVDGCKGGWLVAITEQWPQMKPSLKVCPKFSDVISETRSCSATVIDIPIGLPQSNSERRCDLQARKAICDSRVPNAHSRVFRPPPRSALQFSDWQGFQRHISELIHISPTKQAFDFSPKIKEVDDGMDPDLQRRILEFHPEPTWKRIAGYTLQSKHNAAGLLERLNVLQKLGANWILEFIDDPVMRKVALDDVLDAVVGLGVADRIDGDFTPTDRTSETTTRVDQHRYPEGEMEMDKEKDLRMEIWF